MGQAIEANPVCEAIDLVGLGAAVGNHAAQPHLVILGLGIDGLHDAVHGKDGVEVVGRHDERAVGVLQGCGKSATNHIAQHIEDDHIALIEQVMLLEQLDRLAHHIAPTARAGRRAARLHAHHAVVALVDEVFDTQLLGVEVDRLQDIDDRGHERLGQGEGGVVLGVAANLNDTLSEFGEGHREVRGGGALANAPLAIDGEDLGISNLHVGVELDLHTALAIGRAGASNFCKWHGDRVHTGAPW